MNTDAQDSSDHPADEALLRALARVADRLDRQKAPRPDVRAITSRSEAIRRLRMRRVAVWATSGSAAAAAAVVLIAVLWPVLSPQTTTPQAPGAAAQQPQDVEGSIWAAMSPVNLPPVTSLAADYAPVEIAASSPSVEFGVSLPSLGESRLGEFSFTVPSVSLPLWTERSSTDES